MKIITVKIKQLTNPEFFEFLRQLVVLLNKYDTTKLKIKPVADALVAIFANLQAALDKEKGNQLTKILNELDQQRDILITAFLKYLEAMTSYPDAAIAAQAQSLLHYVEGFSSNIAKETQLAETTILTNITEGIINNPTRSAALAAMHGTLWITSIASVNANYASQYSNRITDDSSNKKVEAFTVVRKTATTAYNQLIDLLESRYKSDKADGLDISLYEKCFGDINELITKVNVLAITSKPNNDKGGSTVASS